MSLTRSITRALTQPLTRRLTAPGIGGGGGVDHDAAAIALFTGGIPGFMLKLDDMTTLFQSSAGTGAVTATSDPIGYAMDVSGNGKHATQATSGTRPLYDPAGAQFTASSLITPAIDLTGYDKVTVVICYRSTAFALGILLESSPNVNSNNGAVSIFKEAGGGTSFGLRGTALGGLKSASIAEPYERVASCIYDLSPAALADEVRPQIDGYAPTLTVSSAGPSGTGNLGNYTFSIGARNGGATVPHIGTISRVFVIAGAPSASGYAIAKNWTGAPAGFVSVPTLSAGAAGINHIISYGQSLSVGVGTGAVISTTQPYDALMFSGGVRAQDASIYPWTQHATLTPLIEAHGPPATGGDRYETPLSGFTAGLREFGSSSQMLASAPGQGALAIGVLSKPGVFYDRFIDDVKYGRYRAAAAGKSYKLRAFTWMQGEVDSATVGYAALMNTLRTDLNNDIKAITGQTEDVWMISYQLDRAKVGLQHLSASDTYGNIRVSAPIYPLGRTDGVHLTPQGSKIMGAYHAIAYKAIVEDLNTSWQPLRCTASVAGAQIDLTYNATSQLVWDTTTVPAQANYGYTVVNSGGTPLTINSVAIVGTNVVRITLSASVPVGAKVYAGFTDPANNTANIDKLNLRDSQGDTIVFDGGGLNYPMHNWAVLQSITL